MDQNELFFTVGWLGPLFGAPQLERYQFTISNGQVTGIDSVIGSVTIPLPLPSNATFAVTASTITETVTNTNSTDVTQYTTDPNNTGLYDVTSQTHTVANPTVTDFNGYSFTIQNGAVTDAESVFKLFGLFKISVGLQILPDTVFAANAGGVTETTVSGNAVTTTQYVQPAGDTLYAVASTSTNYISAGASATQLLVVPFERAHFTFDANGDVTQVQAVYPNGSAATIAPNSHITYSQLAPGFVQETATYGTHSAYEVFYDASGHGTYTEVAEGMGSTVDLVGLKGQLAQLPSGLEALV